MVEVDKKTKIRITYYNALDYTIFDIIEEVLNRSGFKVKQCGGGGFFDLSNTERKSGVFNDFKNLSDDEFDIEFAEQIVGTLLPKFKIEIV